ncbi:MAG: undecaprenyldiphospho-muramoylpentapeptide beta-N-acetylglucosaminyltransferase [Gammaproteobacteria bacterium]|nr:undecaprenyldiphospho-muramoylpentapeptide beta-N-acetylglucosaminyltransferase [Gammaproteobacteria bacterium]
MRDKGHQVHWLGAQGGMEVELVSGRGIPMSLIHIRGLRGKGLWRQLLAPVLLLRALGEALMVVRRVRPDCVLGMGGFVTGPGGLAAWLLRVPLVIHEQNAIAGMTNRLLARVATLVLEAFPGSFPARQVTRVTGNPVRRDVAEVVAPEQRYSERQGPLNLLVLGGSLGAQALNATVPAALALLPNDQRPCVRHQCGRQHEGATREAYECVAVDASVEPFIADMAAAYAWADLVICRAGALTLAELCAAGVGAILVPFPHAVDDHQTHNARYMAGAGGAVLVAQADLTAQGLAEQIAALTIDRTRIERMAQAARQLARTDATDRVVNYCLETARV